MRDFYSISSARAQARRLPRKLVRLVVIGAAAALVPASVYAWHAAASAGQDKSSQSSSSSGDHKDASAADSNKGGVHSELHVSATSNQPASDNQGTATGHVSASISGNTSATVTVNGHTTALSPNSAIDQTVSSNSNATNLSVTLHSDSQQQVSGSSSVDVQVMSDSEGGQ